MTIAVGIYARISDDPTGVGAGVNRQIEDARALCERRGWTPVGEPYVDNDLSADNVRRPRTGQDSPTLGLDRDEARRLLAAAAAHSLRARALITLLIYDGLRISEALGADTTDLSTVRGHRVLAITRKGGVRRFVALPPAVCDALDEYLEHRPTGPDGPLFATRTGGRFDPAEAWRLVRRLAIDAGLNNAAQLSPHSLRHTFVTLAREAGVPLEDVQDAAGHADPRTTRRYDRGRHNLDRSPVHALGVFLANPFATAEDPTP